MLAHRAPGRIDFARGNGGGNLAMLGGGELIGAFADRPEVAAVAAYLTSADYANERLKLGNWLTPNKQADISLVTDPLEAQFAQLLADSDVFRFDGSDLMPGKIGAGAFCTIFVNSGRYTSPRVVVPQ